MKMKSLVQILLALVAISTVTSLAGAWSPAQEPQKPAKKVDHPGGGQGGKGGARKIAQKGGGRTAKEALIKKALPTLKTTLSEAIGLAEKETTGKAFSAGMDIADNKISFQVNMFVGDKMTIAKVDPDTKKVTLQGNGPEGKKPAGGDDDGDDEGGEEDGDQ